MPIFPALAKLKSAASAVNEKKDAVRNGMLWADYLPRQGKAGQTKRDQDLKARVTDLKRQLLFVIKGQMAERAHLYVPKFSVQLIIENIIQN